MSTRCRRFIPPAGAINRIVHRERLAPFSSRFYHQIVYKALLTSGLLVMLHESFTRFSCRASFSQTTFMPKMWNLLRRDWCQLEQLLMISIKFFIANESLGYKVFTIKYQYPLQKRRVSTNFPRSFIYVFLLAVESRNLTQTWII